MLWDLHLCLYSVLFYTADIYAGDIYTGDIYADKIPSRLLSLMCFSLCIHDMHNTCWGPQWK